MPPEEYEKVVRFNTLGTFLPCQAVGKLMIEQKKGKIINMGSVQRLGRPLHGRYRLCHQQGRRASAHPDPGGGMGQVRHQRQRRRAGP